MFSFTDQLCKITSCTNVSEKHGKERKAAISIGLYLVGSQDLLNHFDGQLVTMIFRRPLPAPGQLPMEHAGYTELRFPFMRNLAWDKKYAGYLLRFQIGASGAEDVLLSECALKDIRFVAQEGGSVGFGFKVTAHPKDEVDHGKIAVRLQQEIIISLTPPDVMPTLFDDQEPGDDSRDPFAGSDIPPIEEERV